MTLSIGIDLSRCASDEAARRLFKKAWLHDPDRIVFVGANPEIESRARMMGFGVEMLPAGSEFPAHVDVIVA